MATVTLGGAERTLRYQFLAFRKLAAEGLSFMPKWPAADTLWNPENQVKILWAGLLADQPALTRAQVEGWLDGMEFQAAYDVLEISIGEVFAAWEGEQRRPPTRSGATSTATPNAPPSDSATAPGSSSA